MSKRMFIPGLSVFCAFAMISGVAATAMAQQVPVRVIQGSDGTMYVVQGSSSWTLVPDLVSDSDVAALNPSGEIDGTFPNELFVVQTPAAPPAAAPAPPAVAPAPAAPAPPAAAAPITGKADLTGKAGNDVVTATAIAPGATITSVVDRNTKPSDYFSIALTAGTKYGVYSSTNNKYNNNGIVVQVLNPDASAAGSPGSLGGYGAPGCSTGNDMCYFTPAISGTYYLQFIAATSGQNYTFTIR